MLSDSFISSTHFTTFTLFSDTESSSWVLIYFFVTDSGLKKCMALCELLHHTQSSGILELEGAQSRKPVTIDFGNERHRERGNVVCPWGWLEEGDEQ
jgi:hypothetical protein